MITSNFDNLSTLLFLHKSAKLGEELKGFILGPKKVYPSVLRIVIYDDIPIVLTVGFLLSSSFVSFVVGSLLLLLRESP